MQNTAYKMDQNATIIFPFFPIIQTQALEANEQQTYKVNAPILDDQYVNNKENNKTPVEPLTVAIVNALRNYFFVNGDYFKSMPTNRRNYLYVVLSLNLMRRCGDMVKMRVCDVLNEDGTFKEHIIFNHEEKTGKRAVVLLNSKCKEALIEYFTFIGSYRMSDWLFPNYKKPGEHMTVDGMRKMLQRTCEKLGIDIHIGTHSLRKTIPHIAITNSNNTEDEVTISQLLNHRDIRTTYYYVGRNQAELDAFVERNAL